MRITKHFNSMLLGLALAFTTTIKGAGQPIDHEDVDLDSFPGGVAIWYLLPEVLSTVKEDSAASQNDNVTGHSVYAVHVHAREKKFGRKLIDDSFSAVTIRGKGLASPLMITTEYAQQHFLASIGKHTKLDVKISTELEKLNSDYSRELVDTDKKVEISAAYCPGGYQVFSFNQSLLWTAPRGEEKGIHVHCFREDGSMKHDYTFSEVWVEGRKLTVDSVRKYAVMKELHRSGLSGEEPNLNMIYAE